MSYGKFKINPDRRINDKRDYQKKIQQMSISLLQEMDKKYDSVSTDKHFQPFLHYSVEQPRNHNVNYRKQTFSSNQKSQKQLSNKYEPLNIKVHTQPDDDSYNSNVLAQMNKQQKKLFQIQQGFQQFQSNMSNQKLSVGSDKENNSLNQNYQQKDDLNQIISSLEKRFIPQQQNQASYSKRSNSTNKSPLKKSTPQSRNSNKQDDNQLRDMIHQLQQKDASQRLDIANLKRLAQDLKQQILDQQNQITEFEKISKRDNDYILKIDKTIATYKFKYQEALQQKDNEIKKNEQFKELIEELQNENNYLKSIIEDQSNQKSTYSKNISQKSNNEILKIYLEDLLSPKFDKITSGLWNSQQVQQQQSKQINQLVPQENYSSSTKNQNLYQVWSNKSQHSNDLSFQNGTPTVKINKLLSNNSADNQQSFQQDNNEGDEQLKQFLSQLNESQAQQMYQMFSQIVEDESRDGNQLNNTEIYEKVVNKVLTFNESLQNTSQKQTQETNYLENYDIKQVFKY